MTALPFRLLANLIMLTTGSEEEVCPLDLRFDPQHGVNALNVLQPILSLPVMHVSNVPCNILTPNQDCTRPSLRSSGIGVTLPGVRC